ncbi:MAG TPA: FAD-linked oxidase C-terminal domain-containing protein, partial [Thermoleophilaceae bacterium]|nr:FAD-linked oxidase C-terminal domain-containing protein [Thermoleophilaceae bacterium]
VLGFEGPERAVRARRLLARALLRGSDAVTLGRSPGRTWARSRFHTPYLRDELLARGVLVDTLETAATWDRLETLHGAVAGALRESLASRDTPAYVMCHVSHLYPSGASLYFTYFALQEEGAELEQWRAAKAAASEAILAGGGTITHHHGVGRDHAPWLGAEAGELWLEALRAAKGRLDPKGIMNPGKLLGAGIEAGAGEGTLSHRALRRPG